MLVFISYRRADSTFAAHALRYALLAAGHEVFLDTGAIAPGQAFREVIRTALERAGLVLALVGPRFEPERLAEPLSPVAFEWRQARFSGCMVHAVLLDGAPMPAEATLPADLRWFCRRSASAIGGVDAGRQIDALVAAVPGLGATPAGAARVLWVDDYPANNEYERAVLRPRGLVFDNVVSTAEAIDQLRTSSYDLVITDLGRGASSDRSHSAGSAFLADPAIARGGPPVIVYAGLTAVARRQELLAAGAFGVCRDREDLFRLVLQALGRAQPGAAPEDLP